MPLRSGLPRGDGARRPAELDADGLPQLVVAVLGGVNHGKTQLVASLCQLLATRGWAEPLEPESLDQQTCERERGLSVELSHAVLRSARRAYTLVDCPGHVEYLKNAVSGIAQADAALFVVDLEAGPDEGTREHAMLARHLGLEAAVVFLGHAEEVPDPEYRALVEADTRALLERCGYEDERLQVVQGSALQAALALDDDAEGTRAPELRPLWRLVEALDALPGQPARGERQEPPVMAIADFVGHPDVGLVALGRLERGTLMLEQEIELFGGAGSSALRHPIRRMWSRHREVARARAGELVGVALPWLQGHRGLRRGLMLGAPDALKTTSKIITRLQTLPPELGERRYVGLHPRTNFQMFIRTSEVNVTIARPAPGFVRTGTAHRCALELARPLVVAPGWPLVLRDATRTVALGSPAADA